MGQPRRIAIFDYGIPLVARTASLVIISVIGGLVLLVAATLLIIVLVRSHLGERSLTEPLRYALAVNPPRQVPASLNGFALWNAIVLVLMLVAYGYPIGQFFFLKSHSVPAIEVTSQGSNPARAAEWAGIGDMDRDLPCARDRRQHRAGGRASAAAAHPDAHRLDQRHADAGRRRQRRARRVCRPELHCLPRRAGD
jgi:hypothetical protein